MAGVGLPPWLVPVRRAGGQPGGGGGGGGGGGAPDGRPSSRRPSLQEGKGQRSSSRTSPALVEGAGDPLGFAPPGRCRDGCCGCAEKGRGCLGAGLGVPGGGGRGGERVCLRGGRGFPGRRGSRRARGCARTSPGWGWPGGGGDTWAGGAGTGRRFCQRLRSMLAALATAAALTIRHLSRPTALRAPSGAPVGLEQALSRGNAARGTWLPRADRGPPGHPRSSRVVPLPSISATSSPPFNRPWQHPGGRAPRGSNGRGRTPPPPPCGEGRGRPPVPLPPRPRPLPSGLSPCTPNAGMGVPPPPVRRERKGGGRGDAPPSSWPLHRPHPGQPRSAQGTPRPHTRNDERPRSGSSSSPLDEASQVVSRRRISLGSVAGVCR
jgi:hypothetical protein